MKKKILFISSNMQLGGFQKSLLAVLKCFDYDRYRVDLLLLEPEGPLLGQIPSQVRVLRPVMAPEYFDRAPSAVKKLWKDRRYGLALRRLFAAGVGTVNKGWGGVILSKAIPPLPEEYDAAIDYNGQHILYYLVDKIRARRKLSFFHSDYRKWPYYKSADRRYYAHVDSIVTVSRLCVEAMEEVFPEYKGKIHCIENIISPKTLSAASQRECFTDGFSGKRLVSVGRVCRDKGVFLALESCALLKAWGCRCRWYWIGPWDGEKEAILDQREKLGLLEDFVFLGPKDDPYGYMAGADILVHPSYFEGKSVAVEEGKVLGVPMVATAFSTVYDQIRDGKTGLIAPLDARELALALRRLLEDSALYDAIKENLQACRAGNEAEITKLYSLLEEL